MKKSRHTYKRIFFCSMILLFCVALLLNGFEIPESASCRTELIETWFLQDPEPIRHMEAQLMQNAVGDYFLVRHEEENGEMQIIVAPLVKQRVLTETNGLDPVIEKTEKQVSDMWIETWPKDSPGSWILYRDSASGKNLRVRYYFVPDSDVYADFFPGKGKCLANFVVFGAIAAARVPVPVSFDWFYTASVEDLFRLTRYTLPWNYTKVFFHSYDDVKQMTGLIRFLLPSLQKAQWFESTSVSSGFLKWIVDGLIRPLTGTDCLHEAQNCTEQSQNGKTETGEALAFIRTLATEAISARTNIVYSQNTSGVDVKTEAFSCYTDSSGLPKTAGYTANSGYPAELLKSVLYVLAVTEADRFFLGAVRQSVQVSSSGQSAERQVFTDTAAFFPWFDTKGCFHVSVFERAKEYTLDEFIDKYRGSFVFLVRIKASKEFYPERFE